MNEKNPLLTAIPEELGIPSMAVSNFIKTLEDNNLNMHSFIMLRHGKIAAEGYWKPFNAERKHRMYSITKCFVSVAIGFMESEGLLKLDDKAISFFEDKLPEKDIDPYVAQTTIKDLLCMTTANKTATYETIKDDDWLKTFFCIKADHAPATVFSYDKSASFVLCAIVERLSGLYLLDYLRPRLLDQIGFSEDAYCLKTPSGISNGSSGLVCTSRDVAKFALVCMNEGKYDGKQLIPLNYIKAATSCQVDTSDNGDYIEDKQGYGYQFWQCSNNGFACRGKGSQLAICIPDKDFILVTTADTQFDPEAEKTIFKALWNDVYNNLSETPLNENINDRNNLYEQISNLYVQTVLGKKTSPIIDKINSRIYRLTNNPMNIVNARIDFNGDTGVIEYEKKNQKYKLYFGLGKNLNTKFPEYNYDCINSGAWLDNKTLKISCNIADENFATLEITIVFDNTALEVTMKKQAESCLDEYEGTAKGEMF